MKLVLSMVTGALLAGSVFAQGVIKNRQERQGKRIEKGVANGQLNEKEARRLEAQQKALKGEIQRDRADGGGLTNKEKAKITKQQNKLSKRIAKQANDKQTQK